MRRNTPYAPAPASNDSGKLARPTKRHGNCTKRMSGKVSHRGSETGSAMKMKISFADGHATTVIKLKEMEIPLRLLLVGGLAPGRLPRPFATVKLQTFRQTPSPSRSGKIVG